MNHAIQRTKLQTCSLGSFTVKIDSVIFWVCLTVLLNLLIEKAPGKVLVVGDDYLIEVSITHGALLVL